VVGSAPIRELCAPDCAAHSELRALVLLEEQAHDLWHDDFLRALELPPSSSVYVANEAVFRKVSAEKGRDERGRGGAREPMLGNPRHSPHNMSPHNLCASRWPVWRVQKGGKRPQK
jgi:hypothetical protein